MIPITNEKIELLFGLWEGHIDDYPIVDPDRAEPSGGPLKKK